MNLELKKTGKSFCTDAASNEKYISRCALKIIVATRNCFQFVLTVPCYLKNGFKARATLADFWHRNLLHDRTVERNFSIKRCIS